VRDNTEDSLKVQDFRHTYQIESEGELKELLLARYEDDLNEFWMRHDESLFPGLAICVKGDLAAIHYFPAEGHPGFQSIGNIQTLPVDGVTYFATGSRTDPIEIQNSAVVESYVAVLTAVEFLTSTKLPQSIEWLEL
jgi:hypothetical protein